MWNNDFGDYIWDVVMDLVDNEKDEEEARKQALEMIESIIKRDNKEIYWLKKFKNMIEKGWN